MASAPGKGGVKAEIAGPTPRASDSAGLERLQRGPRICMASLSTSHPGQAWLPALKGTAGSELPMGKPRTRLVWVSLLLPTSRLRLPVARPSAPNSFCSWPTGVWSLLKAKKQAFSLIV